MITYLSLKLCDLSNFHWWCNHSKDCYYDLTALIKRAVRLDLSCLRLTVFHFLVRRSSRRMPHVGYE